jgi:hypothetical protein
MKQLGSVDTAVAATALSGKQRRWVIERWGGTIRSKRRIIFTGPEDSARKKYEELNAKRRRGDIALIDANGNTVRRESAPWRRTRW